MAGCLKPTHSKGSPVSEFDYDSDNDNDDLDGAAAPSGHKPPIAYRFRGFLPVVVDVECGGFNAATDALLEIAATTIAMDDDGMVYPDQTYFFRVEPFEGANIEPAALEFTGIKLDHPLRMAVKDCLLYTSDAADE